ncbi:RNA-directed DNA polymerase, eukaryota [Tanacetum coccineum]
MSSNVRGGSKASNASLLERLSCNIFLIIPPNLTAKELWNTCGLYGTVLDIYIPNKLSKQGKPFAFARFNRVTDVEFKESTSNTSILNTKPKASSHTHMSSSTFVNVVKGKEFLQRKDEPVMVLEYGSLDYEGNLVLVGCVKDFKTILNIHNVCSSKGFTGVTVSYLGGYWVLLEFESTQSCDKFQKHSGINSWFSCIKQWSKDFEVPDKVVWIDVEGIPLQAWSHSTFNKIAHKWGELVYMDDSNSSNKYSIRLCIKTRVQQLITESFKVVLRGEISVVRAKEITGWVLEFGREDEKQFEEQSEADKLSLQEEDEDDKVVPGAFQHDANIHVLILESAKKGDKDPLEKYSTEPQFPPSFTPVNSNHQDEKVVKDTHEESSVSVNNDDTYVSSKSSDQVIGIDNMGNDCNIESRSKNVFSKSHNLDHVDSLALSSKPIEGFSILEHFNEFISVGQAMGFGMKGWTGRKEKKDWVKSLCHTNGVNFLSIQETKMGRSGGLINRWHGEVVIMGDFIEVRFASERYGTIFHASHANIFNLFITDSHLIDVPLGGYSFTWYNKHASKMSKLDRILYGLWPYSVLFIHFWFLENDFVSVVEDAWNNAMVHDLNAMVFLKNKLKALKHKLKAWSCQKRSKRELDCKELHDKLIDIDTRLDKGEGLHDDVYNRADVFRKIGEIDLKNSTDMAQKAKIKWAIEGDENSKFFHGIVNKNRRQQAIKGILVDGEWIDNPEGVKKAFFNHFSNRFASPDSIRVPLDGNFPRCLEADFSNQLEEEVSNVEIKNAVWDCGSDKSPGPDVLDAKPLNDFRPISLIGCQYKIIGKILANRLSLVIDKIVSIEQSAFIKGRQILDGPLTLNEIVSWCKIKNEQALMLKVDFQKAFDSVRWDYLDDILNKFGFGVKWRGWIRGCLLSSKASVLVNGSPTHEFSFHKGLRQGDPLSPFLFILVMESLHVSFQRLSIEVCFLLLLLVPMRRSLSRIYSMPFTYLRVKFRANMAHIGSWNIIVQKVKSKLSSWKSKTLSVGGRLTLIKSVLGALPTYYMSLFRVPDGVLNQLEGLHNSFFLGADIFYQKMTWVCWKKVMAQKQYGGLGVSNVFALNRALLYKWIWWFYASQSGLWLDVIKAIHGSNGALDQPLPNHIGCSVWNMVRKAIGNLKSKNVDLMDFCKKVIGNGYNSSFWHEIWLGEECFKVRFNRLFNLELNKDVSVGQKLQNSNWAFTFRRRHRGGSEECQWIEFSQLLSSVVLSSASDRWSWSLNGDGVFSMKSAREIIDNHVLANSTSTTRWSKLLPIKVNVFAWRMFLDKLR